MIAAVEEVLRRAGADAGEVEVFAHGMTVGTNALLEERGARTALIATRGFADLLEIGRQDRPELYRLCAPKPPPLVEPELRFEAAERVGPGGHHRAASAEDEPARLAELIREAAPSRSRSACSSPTSTPPTSRRSPSICAASCPDVHVSASHEVLPRFREYERCSTTAIDAYLSPLLGRYLGALSEAAAEARPAAPRW